MVSILFTYRPGDFATNGAMGDANVIVVHDIECPLADGYAQELTGPNYLGATQANMGNIKSVHYVVGPDGICASVPEDTMAWHARGASYGAWGIEQTGYASFTRDQWMSPLGMLQLNYLASLIADMCTRHGLPIRFLAGGDLHNAYADHSNKAAGGITTHRQLTIDGIGGNDHTDPGAYYPMDYVLGRAQQIANGNAPAPTPIPIPVEDDDMLSLVRDVNDPDGATYAVGPNVFKWVTSSEEIDSGDAAGLWDKTKVRTMNERQRDVVRAFCMRENGTIHPK